MIVNDNSVQVDQRYIPSVRRTWTGDSRHRTLAFIDHVINWAQHYCTEAVGKVKNNDLKQFNMERLIDMQKLLTSALTGLGRLSITYGDDKLNMATIDNFKSRVTTFCDQDLKNAIDADKAK